MTPTIFQTRHRAAHPDWRDLIVTWLHLPSLGISIVVSAEEVTDH